MRKRPQILIFVLISLILFGWHPAAAQPVPAEWAEGGANAKYFNGAAALEWVHRLGDWSDAEGRSQGEIPYAVTRVAGGDSKHDYQWDITPLVRAWLDGSIENNGMFLRVPRGGSDGTATFHSREAERLVDVPVLILEWSSGKFNYLPASRDTHLDGSTVRMQGKRATLQVGGGKTALISFELASTKADGELRRASFGLTTSGRQYGNADVGIFLPATNYPPAGDRDESGIAVAYPADRDIVADPNVLFSESFESRSWEDNWSILNPSKSFEPVAADASHEFVPISGKALKVTIFQGNTLGLDLRYQFAEETGAEPEEMFFRYYLRLASDWRPNVDGGKLPGLAGTYNKAGWGGRRSDGRNGWSTRGSFLRYIEGDNPLSGRTPIGSYAYYADMPDFYGSGWIWAGDGLGMLQVNTWYAIEQYVKMNDPGVSNGIFRSWIDGQLALEKTDILFRHDPALKIENVWMNVYHGGTAPAPTDLILYLDNVVVARSYIGPMR